MEVQGATTWSPEGHLNRIKRPGVEASWSCLEGLSKALGGALQIAARKTAGDRLEVKGRSGEHLSLAMAPRERHYQRMVDWKQQPTSGNAGSEHSLGQRTGGFL